MFQVKICGVRLKSDIGAAASAGADAIGLNFFDNSIRFVDPRDDATKELAAFAEARRIMSVGVFVNASVDEIARIASELGLSAVQLHGNESPSIAAALIDRGLTVIRAIKLPVANLSAGQITQSCQPWHDLGCHLLLDADAGQAHGGSGKCLDWQTIRHWSERQAEDSWTLAGGLSDENVAAAIEISGARSVDTASGVEQPRGTKSPQRIERFVKFSLEAFRQQGRKPH